MDRAGDVEQPGSGWWEHWLRGFGVLVCVITHLVQSDDVLLCKGYADYRDKLYLSGCCVSGMAEPEVTGTLAQVQQEKRAAMIREQNTVVTNVELVATLLLLVAVSPVVLPIVVVGHVRTKRAIARA